MQFQKSEKSDLILQFQVLILLLPLSLSLTKLLVNTDLSTSKLVLLIV